MYHQIPPNLSGDIIVSRQGDVWTCLERLRSSTAPPLSNGSNLKLEWKGMLVY